MILCRNLTLGCNSSWPGKSIAIAALSAFLMVGCSTTMLSGGSDSQGSLDTLLNQADNELAKGRRDQAIALLNRAAKENPTSMAPWLKISNIWFDEGNYPSSILAANEVLERDVSNQEAKSILVVAGLRVAAGAVKGLVSQNAVNSNARVEAENLTKSLRTALGEKVLVPTTTTAEAPRPRPKPIAVKPKVTHENTATASTAPAGASVSVAAPSMPQPAVSVVIDPFKSLK